jgi:two-component system phosphate regulon sensor histidine kinase PhoR
MTPASGLGATADRPPPPTARRGAGGALWLRLAAAYVALIALAMATLGAVLARAEERRFRSALDERLLAEARLVAEAVTPLLRAGGTVEAVDPLAKRLGEESGAHITLIAPDGTVLGDSANDPRRLDNHAGRPEVQSALAGGAGRATRRSDTERRAFSYVAVLVRDGDRLLGVARVATPESAVNANLRGMVLTVLAATAIAALCAGLLAVVVARAITRPLERLRRAARALADGAFDQRVTAGGGGEVAELAEAFNDMAGRLRETVTTLAQERTRLEALLASSGDALIALDGAGIVRYLNPAAVALLGPAEGRPFAEAARNHELSELLRVARAEHRRASAALALDGRDVWVQATVSPIAGGGGWATLVILHDISEVRRAETARRDFVANVSHELRTPLAGIKAVVETLRDGALHDPAAADEFLGHVDAEVERLVQLVEELLQLARIESGAALQPEDVEPYAVLAACVERFRHMAERAGVTLALEAPAGLPLIRADPARLGQAVGNLVHNAIKFTPPGGRVTVAAAATAGALIVRVADTGSGIDPADLPRIFERFYVADRARSGRGTGLGLAIVKHVVRAHGGTVDARSVPGRGATFTITLPLGRQADTAVAGRTA